MATDSPSCAGARSGDLEYVDVMASESACADVDLLVMQWPGKVPPDPDRMMLQSQKLSAYNHAECKYYESIHFHGGW